MTVGIAAKSAIAWNNQMSSVMRNVPTSKFILAYQPVLKRHGFTGIAEGLIKQHRSSFALPESTGILKGLKVASSKQMAPISGAFKPRYLPITSNMKSWARQGFADHNTAALTGFQKTLAHYTSNMGVTGRFASQYQSAIIRFGFDTSKLIEAFNVVYSKQMRPFHGDFKPNYLTITPDMSSLARQALGNMAVLSGVKISIAHEPNILGIAERLAAQYNLPSQVRTGEETPEFRSDHWTTANLEAFITFIYITVAMSVFLMQLQIRTATGAEASPSVEEILLYGITALSTAAETIRISKVLNRRFSS